MIGILFDLDGTLLDTLDDLTCAVNFTLGSFGYPQRTREEVRRFVGNGAARLLQLSVPVGEDWREPFALFQEYYRAHCQEKTAPYPGIPAALEALKDYPIAIVSNKPDAAAKKLCARHFPGIYTLGESPLCPRKPASDMLKLAMERIGVTQCIYVGDSEVDVLTAKNADVPCLSVLWGFRDEDEIRAAGGNSFCAVPAELPAKIERMRKEELLHGE